jgi:acyl-CoA hydrolase
MEIGLSVSAWKPGQKSEAICRAYMTFVAIDDQGLPQKVPAIIPETPDQIRRYNNAEIRRKTRLELKEKLL